jgi:hypothetical protein
MTPPEPEGFSTTVRRTQVGRQRALRWLWRRAFWVTAAASIALFGLSHDASVWALRGGLFGAFALLLWEMVAGVERGAVVMVSYQPGVVTLRDPRGEEVLTRAALREGMVREAGGRATLRLESRAGWRYDLAMPDVATAERWLAELGLDARQRKARVVTDRAAIQWMFAYFFGGLFAMPFMMVAVALSALFKNLHGDIPFLYLTMLPGYWLAARSVGRVDVTVGVDGVYAGRGWWRRFFPVEAIESAALDGSDVCAIRIWLHSRASHRYRFATEADAAAVLQRIHGVLALRDALPATVARVLATSGVSTAEGWGAAFTDALHGATYRDAALTPDDLARVIAAPGVTSAQRVGAALALRAMGDGAVTGVRVASEALTAPPTLQAIERTERGEARRGAR